MMFGMPGKSHRGPLPPLSEGEVALRDALKRDLETLARDIGERNVYTCEKLNAAADFVELSLRAAGCPVERQAYEVLGKTCCNIEAQLPGTDKADEIVIIGAHYDSLQGTVGANDNGTGVAAVLALARAFAGVRGSRTLRFVAFANEEPPFFQTPLMGSLVYAKRCRERNENIVAMLSLETIGYYSDEKGSQKYPFPFDLFYPSVGNFIAFVGNTRSAKLVRQVVGSFRQRAQFPSQGGALPEMVAGIAESDQWAFWQQGYPAVMVTDTAPFRYPYYHTTEDTIDKVDFDRFTRVVAGLEGVVNDLTR